MLVGVRIHILPSEVIAANIDQTHKPVGYIRVGCPYVVY
jgi:hypothetical protein